MAHTKIFLREIFVQPEREGNLLSHNLVDSLGFTSSRGLGNGDKSGILMLCWQCVDFVHSLQQDFVCSAMVFCIPSADYS
jgi:hypothetical protein